MGVKSEYDGIVIVELFPHCNYHCSFCYQNSEERPSYFTENHKLFEKSKMYYMNMFIEKYKSYNLPEVDFCDFWGGELFYDNTPEYNELLMKVIKTVNPRKKFGVTTNLSNINPCLQSLLFDKQPFTLEIGASYDAIGRFHTKEMLDNYLKNLEIIKKSPNLEDGKFMVETVLTPEMLDDKYDFTVFDKLYEDEQIDNCLLLDFRGYPDYILKNFGERVMKLLTKYPKLDNTENFLAFTNIKPDIERTPYEGGMDRYCYCYHPNTHYFSYVTQFDLTHNHCSSCKEGDYKLVEESWGCKDCKYNTICSDICPGSVINSGLVKIDCPYKYVYDNIHQIKRAYIEDLKKNDKETLKEMYKNQFGNIND